MPEIWILTKLFIGKVHGDTNLSTDERTKMLRVSIKVFTELSKVQPTVFLPGSLLKQDRLNTEGSRLGYKGG